MREPDTQAKYECEMLGSNKGGQFRVPMYDNNGDNIEAKHARRM